MDADGQFRRRVLVVDGDPAFLRSCTDALRAQGYEVITAGNGFEALHVLRGAQPDLLVTELNLPQMSGFELLSVVRTRFPLISVIALSGEYTAVTVPHEAICDRFVGKGPNSTFEMLAAARTLISESPIRGSRPRSELAPVWVPRSATGYVILTCPECLRSFSVPQPQATPSRDICIFCGADVHFQISSIERAPAPETSSETPLDRAREARAKSQAAIDKSRRLREKPGS